uniref:Uncharacterized protein n=1 Tax=Cacopsylla melanoneura TaxID=428564 RepID=A0A8D8PX33_9HEMI
MRAPPSTRPAGSPQWVARTTSARLVRNIPTERQEERREARLVRNFPSERQEARLVKNIPSARREIEKTDENVTVEAAEDLSTLAIIQKLLVETNKDLSVETDKGLSKNKQGIQETLVETNKGLSNKKQVIQNTLVQTDKDLSNNKQAIHLGCSLQPRLVNQEKYRTSR